MATLTVHHYLDSITSFINNVETSKNTYYLFVGKPDPWLNPAGAADDSSNNIISYHAANDSIYSHESSIYHDMVFGKLLQPDNISYMIPRNDWVSGQVYNQYDQYIFDLYNNPYYVVTDNNEVYKCIDNNNGANSTIKPSLTTQSGTFMTGDGYTWKYMYTIDTASDAAFSTSSYIPVTPNNSVSANAIPGTLDVIRLTNGGNGYPYYTGYLVASTNNKVVVLDQAASYSNDYYTNSSMYLEAGYGAGQVRKIVKYDGLNRLATLETPFERYGTFNLSNITNPGNFVVSNFLVQNIDSIAVLYTQGIFQIGDTIVQSDTGASADIVQANSTVFNTIRPAGANAFSLTYPIYNSSQSGSLKAGTVDANGIYVYSTNTAQTSFTTDFAINDFIRIGSNANTNIRRITAVNTSTITLSNGLSGSYTANAYYKIPYVFEPTSITLNQASGLISNTNIYGVKISYTNRTNLSVSFTVGERVDMVNSSNAAQGPTGIVSYANNDTVVLTSVTGGSFSTSFNLRGESSLQSANISSVDSYPNITVSDPLGTFYSGLPATVRDTGGSILAQANIVSYFIIPNQTTEYVISPTVEIIGDGSNASAYSIVDTSNASSGALTEIKVINPGSNYTFADLNIVSNTFHGSGATGNAVISPAAGHGSNSVSELGSIYAGITVNISNGQNESFRYPVYGSYRRIGLIKNPLFDNVTVDLDSFERVSMSVNTVIGAGFSTNEYVLQSNTGAVGKVVFANSSHIELGSVQGTFSANNKYANGAASNDNIVGLVSNTVANVALANVIYFSLGNVVTVSELTSGATAVISQKPSNTQLVLTNVGGRLDINDTLYDPVTNAYANVTTILISNGTVDVSTIFAKQFNQTLRFPLTTNTAPFTQYEMVTQQYSNASGMVISDNNEWDISYSGATGSFSVGNIIYNSGNTARGIVNFANSTYLRLTATTGRFTAGDTIINNLSIGANISNAYPALVLSDVTGSSLFSAGALSGNVTGSNSGSIGRCNALGTIDYPDLVRNSGEVTYLENMSSIFSLSNTSTETIKIVIKF